MHLAVVIEIISIQKLRLDESLNPATYGIPFHFSTIVRN